MACGLPERIDVRAQELQLADPEMRWGVRFFIEGLCVKSAVELTHTISAPAASLRDVLLQNAFFQGRIPKYLDRKTCPIDALAGVDAPRTLGDRFRLRRFSGAVAISWVRWENIGGPMAGLIGPRRPEGGLAGGRVVEAAATRPDRADFWKKKGERPAGATPSSPRMALWRRSWPKDQAQRRSELRTGITWGYWRPSSQKSKGSNGAQGQ